ncbi:MAG: 6-bladed beta-propeller [Pseudomonadota bacterium]
MPETRNRVHLARILLLLFFLLCIPGISIAEEIYKFERMWPTLQQPWYFSKPKDIAVGRNGYIYVVDSWNHRIQKFTLEGQLVNQWGRDGTGDGDFHYPYGIAVDGSGFVYVTDSLNYRVQKFTANGQFVTKWGSKGGVDGMFGEGQSLNMYGPSGIAVDGSGFVYVADTGNHRIQKFTPDGQFVAKFGNFGSGNGLFINPYDIALDSSGFVYIADTKNHRVQKLTSDGQYISQWGSQGIDDGQFNWPEGIAVDGNGFVYVTCSQNYRIQKFNPVGEFVTKWGGYGVSDGKFGGPGGIAVDPRGYVLVADISNNRIQWFTSNGTFITKWAGGGTGQGKFNNPAGIGVDSIGFIYIADTYNNRIQKFSPVGQFETAWGTYGSGQGEFYYPKGIAISFNDHVYVADTMNHRIQEFNSDGVFLAEWGSEGAANGQFNRPRAVAVDSSSFLYVADSNNHRLQKFNADGEWLATWGSYGFGDDNFYYPHGIVVDGNGYIYVADTWNSHIKKLAPDGGHLSTWGAYSSGAGDGEFASPEGITVDGNGFIYVADTLNDRIQKLDSDGNFITKFGGKGSDPGQMSRPRGLAIGPDDKIFVVDSENNRIQAFNKVTSDTNNKAIIVSGGGPFPGNNLWDATQMSANFAYRTLTYQGFTKENIHYLTSSNIDLDDNGVMDDVAGDATTANLQNAITTWASGAEDVIVYLVDHGGMDSFRINGNETLSAAQLASWLNTLQESITGKVILVYDACNSGSFVNDLVPPSDKSRIVMTSTSPGESAYFVTQGSVSFSNYFWTHIFNGVNIKDAFSLTKDAIAYTTPYQHPLLDADGNGTANEAEDLTLVQSAYIGNGTVIYGSAPLIGTVSPDQTINDTSSALLYADNVTDADGIARVWAVIRPPDYNQGGSDNPVQSLPSIDLMPVGNDRYEATYSAFNIPGTYQIAIYARDRIGNTSIPSITTVSVTNPLRRKAIIAAGGSQSDSLWPAIERGAKLSYDALRFQGYADDDLYLLSPASITGVTKLSVLATRDNLIYAITDWASGNTQDVALYLIGRGDSGIFRINNEESVSATELRSWLDTLQGIIPGVVTVVYDGPLSGSFLPLLKPPSGKQRILLSSTGGAQPVYFLSNGNISFSRFFWGNVLNGASLWDAYINARRAVGFLCAGQTPLLDDNADGISTKSDGSIARNYILGFGITLAADDPLIGSVSPLQTLIGGTSATVWAKDVTTTGTIDKVWALITPPGGNQTPLNVPVTSLPGIIELTYNASSSSYEGSYNGFSTYGQYDIAIYAMDTEGNISEPRTTTVTQSVGPDAYEDDNTREKASVIILNDENHQRHNFHAAGDVDWVKVYAVKDQVYEMKAGNLGIADAVLELYKAGDVTTDLIAGLGDLGGAGEDELVSWTAPDSGIYYLKVRQYDPGIFGEGTHYDLKVYRPTAPDIGTITGIIISDLDLARITSATIQAGLGSALSQDGSFILKVEAGTVNLSVNADGFNSSSVQNVVVQTGQETPVTVRMVSLGSDLTVTAAAGQNGRIYCTPNPVNYGGSSTCTISPDVGYQVDAFTVNWSPATLTNNQYVFSNVTANHTVNVTFKLAVAHGDVNNDGSVDLADAIMALQVTARIPPAITPHLENDVNGDGKIGLPEVIYILQKIAGTRAQ